MLTVISAVVLADDITLTMTTVSDFKGDSPVLSVDGVTTYNMLPDESTVHTLQFNCSGDFMFGDVANIDVYVYNVALHSEDYDSATADGIGLVSFNWYSHMTPPDTWTMDDGNTDWVMTGYYDPYESFNDPTEITLNFTIGTTATPGTWKIVVVQDNLDDTTVTMETGDLTVTNYVSMVISRSTLSFSDLGPESPNDNVSAVNGAIVVTVNSNCNFDLRVSGSDLTGGSESVPLSNNVLACNNSFIGTTSSTFYTGSSSTSVSLVFTMAWDDLMEGGTTYSTSLSISVVAL